MPNVCGSEIGHGSLVTYCRRPAGHSEPHSSTVEAVTVSPRAGHPVVYKALEQAADLHDAKNQGYRSADDPLANFKEAPPVTKGLLTPLQYAYTLMAKQDDALARLVWDRATRSDDGVDTLEYAKRGGDVMLRERLMDGIVYRALMLALMEDAG